MYQSIGPCGCCACVGVSVRSGHSHLCKTFSELDTLLHKNHSTVQKVLRFDKCRSIIEKMNILDVVQSHDYARKQGNKEVVGGQNLKKGGGQYRKGFS